MQKTEENDNQTNINEIEQINSRQPLNQSTYLDRKMSQGFMFNESPRPKYSDTPLNFFWKILNILRFK